MVLLKNILAATDFGPASDAALTFEFVLPDAVPATQEARRS